jgi:acyl carrier protein
MGFWKIKNKKAQKLKDGKTMIVEQAKEIVISAIKDALEEKVEVKEDMQLIGGDSSLDSMKLVEVCLALEDLADEHGFEFDWTSEAAMSKSRSMFRNVAALAEEFANQSES